MSDKRRRHRSDLGDGTDNEYDDDSVDDDARDSLDLDAETEAQQRRDMARIQSAWDQRAGLMQQTIASLQDPTVMRAMQMILNLGLVSPTAEFTDILQLGMRDIEEKQRQEEERRRQRRANPVNSSRHSAYNADGFVADVDAVVRRSQAASLCFGPGPQPRRPTILERLEEKKQAPEPPPLSRVNVSAGLFGSDVDSISNRIRDFSAQSRDGDVDDEQYETESERNRRWMSQRNDFEWDDVVPPSPVPEDESNDGSSEDDDDDSSDANDDEEGNDDE